MKRLCRITALVLLALAVCVPSQAVQAQVDSGQSSQTLDDYAVFLPLIRDGNVTSLSGLVTLAGEPMGGLKIVLYRQPQGQPPIEVASSTTLSDGTYRFSSLEPTDGDTYYAVYHNSGMIAGRIISWQTGGINSLAFGAQRSFAPFDIADLVLSTPAENALVSFPVTFTWTQRPNSPTDNFRLTIMQPPMLADVYQSGDLGNVPSYTLHSLPGGMSTGTPYYWVVRVYGPDGGWGASSNLLRVTFQ